MIDVTESAIFLGDNRKHIPDLPDGSIDCIVTDPPYGVNYWSRSAETAEGKRWVKKVASDDNLDNALALFDEVMGLLEPKVKPDVDAYIFTRWDIVGYWIEAIARVPWLTYKMLLVWEKGSPGMGDIDANWGCGHELILYCKGDKRRDVAYRRSGVLHFDRVPPGKAIHPTEKPVPLLSTLIEMSTDVGDIVLDPFSGSGSTVMAAKEAGRIGIGFEEDEDHFRRSTNRISQEAMF